MGRMRRNVRHSKEWEEWIPPAVGLTPEDFYGKAVNITDVMFRFKQKMLGRVVNWGADTSKIPADLWVDINADDWHEATQVSIKLIKWLGRNGLDIFVEGPLEHVGPNTWRFKCRVVAV